MFIIIGKKALSPPPLRNGTGGFFCFTFDQANIPCILTYLNLLNFSLYFPTNFEIRKRRSRSPTFAQEPIRKGTADVSLFS